MIMPPALRDIIDNLPYLSGKYRDVPALLLLPFIALAAPFAATWLRRSARWLDQAALAAALAIVAIMLWTSATYLTLPGYLDHVEASVVVASWWLHQGHPIYPDWSGQGIYGLVYGPLLFQSIATALTVSPTVLFSKLPGFIAFWLACVALAAALRPMVPSFRQCLLPVAILVIMAGCYWRAAYWVRAEPLLILVAALALLSYTRLRPTTAAVALGLLAGAAINLKIHGAPYVLPCAVGLLLRPAAFSARVKLAGLGTAAGLLALIAPFLDPDISLTNYVAFIWAVLHHGIDPALLKLNLRFSGVLVLPVLFLGWRHLRGDRQGEWPMYLSYILSVAIVCAIGAKRGAGPTHLLPFLPLFVYLLVRAAQSLVVPASADSRAAGIALAVLAIVLCYSVSIATTIDALRARSLITDDPGIERDAAALYSAFPDASMGAGDNTGYMATEYKVLGVLAGAPLVFDSVTWMDVQKGGDFDQDAVALVTDCRTPVWIVPHGGQPFSMTGPYGPEPLFSDRFRARFQADYRVVRDGRFFSVWRCGAGGSHATGGAPSGAH